jgi:hypothetical protein
MNLLIDSDSSEHTCGPCPPKSRCCPRSPQRRVPRNLYEEARNIARGIAKTKQFVQTRRDRKKVEMLFAHLKRILRLGRLRLRGPSDAQFEFTLAAIAQNLRRLGKMIARPPPLAIEPAAKTGLHPDTPTKKAANYLDCRTTSATISANKRQRRFARCGRGNGTPAQGRWGCLFLFAYCRTCACQRASSAGGQIGHPRPRAPIDISRAAA